jgi:CheY-like chemotaxis protein
MRILVVDRDAITAQLVSSKMTTLGHSVTEEPNKNEATDQLEQGDFDAIFIDPAPLSNPRPLMMNLRRASKKWPYVVLLSSDENIEELRTSGANEVLQKPIDIETIDRIATSAERLTKLVDHMGDESEDFPSAGGVIAKSAFNQLFLSCIERADRHGAGAYMIFVRLNNYKDIMETDGPYAAEFANAQMSQQLVRLRRQSDIIGQTGKNEFCLLILMPQNEDEPKMAAQRFADSFENFEDICVNEGQKVEIEVSLVALPRGVEIFRHISVSEKTRGQNSA